MNDTLTAYTASAIFGTKTVGIAPSDYRTIADAFNAIRYAGISNDLTIKVKSGTYIEPLELPAVDYNNSAIPSKNIILESQSGSKDVFIVTNASIQTSIKLIEFETVTFTTDFKNEVKEIFSKKNIDLEKMTLLNAWIAQEHAGIINLLLEKWKINAAEVDLIMFEFNRAKK